MESKSEEKVQLDQVSATLKLVEKLKTFPPPLNYLPQFLQKYGGVLTGSFLFSCVMPTTFAPHDIDVVFGENYAEAAQAMEKMGWRCGANNRLKSREGYCNLAHVTEEFNMIFKNQPEDVSIDIVDGRQIIKTKYPENVKFNFIVYKQCKSQSDIQKSIDENFDLNGTTLQFDGKSWHIAADVDLDSFLNKKVMSYRKSQLVARAPPYLRFRQHHSICNDIPWEISVCGWIEERLKKYESRGFTITNAGEVREHLRQLLEKSEDKDVVAAHLLKNS